jgi:hypothetical protein
MAASLRTASALVPVRAESSNPWTIAPSFVRSRTEGDGG